MSGNIPVEQIDGPSLSRRDFLRVGGFSLGTLLALGLIRSISHSFVQLPIAQPPYPISNEPTLLLGAGFSSCEALPIGIQENNTFGVGGSLQELEQAFPDLSDEDRRSLFSDINEDGHRFPYDDPDQLGAILATMKYSGLNALRISLPWTRMVSRDKEGRIITGQFDEIEIDKFSKAVRQIKSEGIIPVVTLKHFEHPDGLDLVENQGFMRNWKSFVVRCVNDILIPNDVKHIILINEPQVEASARYIFKNWKPNEDWDPISFIRSMSTLGNAAEWAYHYIHKTYLNNKPEINPNVIVTFNMSRFVPNQEDPITEAIANDLGVVGNLLQTLFFQRTHLTLLPPKLNRSLFYDTLGAQIYYSMLLPFYNGEGNFLSNHNGFSVIRPDSIPEIFDHVRSYLPNVPIALTEVGADFIGHTNPARLWFLKETGRVLQNLFKEGLNMALFWSLVRFPTIQMGSDHNIGGYQGSDYGLIGEAISKDNNIPRVLKYHPGAIDYLRKLSQNLGIPGSDFHAFIRSIERYYNSEAETQLREVLKYSQNVVDPAFLAEQLARQRLLNGIGIR